MKTILAIMKIDMRIKMFPIMLAMQNGLDNFFFGGNIKIMKTIFPTMTTIRNGLDRFFQAATQKIIKMGFPTARD
jgi:hypothetical protein